jgi:hypothetical protein
MKPFIYAILTTLALVLLVAASASAQTPPVHPSDPNAVLIGTFEVTISVSGGTTSTARTGVRAASTSTEDCQIKSTIQVWRTSTGAIDYVIDASSITYVGNCGSLGMTTADVFGLLSQAALSKGISLGYSSCSGDCATQNAARVYAALCVRSSGSGESTRYEPCDMTSFCYREYAYCCPDGTGTPQITEIPRTGDGCGTGVPSSCEPTCTSGSGLLK